MTDKLKPFHKSFQNSRYILNELGIDLSKRDSNFFVESVRIQMAKIHLILSMKIKPDKCIGNTFGKIFCAHIDGNLTEEHVYLMTHRLACSKFNYMEFTLEKFCRFLLDNFQDYYFIIKFVDEYLFKMNCVDHLEDCKKKLHNTILLDFSTIPKNDIIKENCEIELDDDCVYLNMSDVHNLDESILEVIGRLYELGYDIDWNALYDENHKLFKWKNAYSKVPILHWDYSDENCRYGNKYRVINR